MSPASIGHLAMLGFSAGVAGSFSLGSMIANDIDPAALTVVRFLLAAAVLMAVAWAGPGIRRNDFSSPWRFAMIGGIYAIYFVLMFEGLKTAPAVSTAAVFTLSPLLSAAFGFLLLRQRLSRRVALALGIGALGALWVIFRADLALLMAFRVERGELLYFIGCVFHAALPAIMMLGARRGGVAAGTGLAMLAGAALLLPWGWSAVVATDWANLPALVWITLAYVSLVATSGTTFLLQFAASRLPAAKVMAYTYLVPSWVILWEIALARPAPPALVLAGVGLTIVSLVILLKPDPV
jgi:drug/metabolite transporter (DMT)-like permease